MDGCGPSWVKPSGRLVIVRKAPSTLPLCRRSPRCGSAQVRWWVMIAGGWDERTGARFQKLLTGVLPRGKSGEKRPVGLGYKPSFAGVFTLMRPRTGALRLPAVGQRAVSRGRADGGLRPRRPHSGAGEDTRTLPPTMTNRRLAMVRSIAWRYARRWGRRSAPSPTGEFNLQFW